MKYDFAISFAGPERSVARDLASRLSDNGFIVFFDEYYEHDMLGRDGSEYLNNVFFRQSRFCVALISNSYEKRAWTRLERRAAAARDFADEGYLLPVLVDSVSPSWLPPTRIRFDLPGRSIEALVEVLIRLRYDRRYGPFRAIETLPLPWPDQPVHIAQVLSISSFLVWTSSEPDEPGPSLLLAKRAATDRWALDSLNLQIGGRFMLVDGENVIAVSSSGEREIHIQNIAGKTDERVAVPRRGSRWSMISDATVGGGAVILGFCGDDVWRLDLATHTWTEILPGDDSTNYAYAHALADGSFLSCTSRGLTFHGPNGETRTLSSTLKNCKVWASEAKQVVACDTISRLEIVDLKTGATHAEHVLRMWPAWQGCMADEVGQLALICGASFGFNVLDLVDVTQHRSVLQTESEVDDPFDDVVLSTDGRVMVLVHDSGITVLERAS